MSQIHLVLEFDRRLEARRTAARRLILVCDGAWIAGVVLVVLAVSFLRNSALLRSSVPSEGMALLALAPGWAVAALAAASAAFTVLRHWSVLPWTSRLIGLAPWAVICFVATVVIRGYLP